MPVLTYLKRSGIKENQHQAPLIRGGKLPHRIAGSPWPHNSIRNAIRPEAQGVHKVQ